MHVNVEYPEVILNIKDVNYKLYENGRHEILNEINKDEVIDDILIWMNGIL